MPDPPGRYLTPPQYAERLGISPDKVVAWIKREELKAVNTSDGTRPRYKISPAAIAEFESRRSPQQKPKRRRRKRPSAVLDIIK